MNAIAPSRVTRTPVTKDGLLYVLHNLREADRREIYALRFDEDPMSLFLDQFPLMGAMCCLWSRGGIPVACQGVIPRWPGVWSMFAYGTDQWPRIVLSMTRHARHFIVPRLLASGVHRCECYALAANTASRRWIEFLGAREEATLQGYGKQQEDFVLYVWRPLYVP